MIKVNQDLKKQHVAGTSKMPVSGNPTLIQLTSEDPEYKASWRRKYGMTQEKDQPDNSGRGKKENIVFFLTLIL